MCIFCPLIQPSWKFEHLEGADFDPEALQSGLGVNFFYLGLANFRKIACKISQLILLANLSRLFLQCFRPPQKFTPQNCRIPFQFHHVKPNINLTRPQLGPFFVLKFVRSRVFGARFLQPFPNSLVTVKYYSNTKMAVNSR